MSYLHSQIIPSLQTLKILGDVTSFGQWLGEKHPDKEWSELFDGYIFTLQCCLKAFTDGISRDGVLDIKNDFLLDRALAEFVYYVHSQYFAGNKVYNGQYSIRLNADKQSGEKDVVIENDSQVILIECKLNPQSYNIKQVIDSLETKLATYTKDRKSYELWFWYGPSTQNEEILRKRKVELVVVSQDRTHKVLKGVDLSQLKHIMQEIDMPHANT